LSDDAPPKPLHVRALEALAFLAILPTLPFAFAIDRAVRRWRGGEPVVAAKTRGFGVRPGTVAVVLASFLLTWAARPGTVLEAVFAFPVVLALLGTLGRLAWTWGSVEGSSLKRVLGAALALWALAAVIPAFAHFQALYTASVIGSFDPAAALESVRRVFEAALGDHQTRWGFGPGPLDLDGSAWFVLARTPVLVAPAFALVFLRERRVSRSVRALVYALLVLGHTAIVRALVPGLADMYAGAARIQILVFCAIAPFPGLLLLHAIRFVSGEPPLPTAPTGRLTRADAVLSGLAIGFATYVFLAFLENARESLDVFDRLQPWRVLGVSLTGPYLVIPWLGGSLAAIGFTRSITQGPPSLPWRRMAAALALGALGGAAALLLEGEGLRWIRDMLRPEWLTSYFSSTTDAGLELVLLAGFVAAGRVALGRAGAAPLTPLARSVSRRLVLVLVLAAFVPTAHGLALDYWPQDLPATTTLELVPAIPANRRDLPFVATETVHFEGQDYLLDRLQAIVAKGGGDLRRVRRIENGVALRLSKDAGRKVARWTSRNLGQLLAVLVNGEVIMIPTVRSTISDRLVIDAATKPADPLYEALTGTRKQ
jgi:hypothetical protein